MRTFRSRKSLLPRSRLASLVPSLSVRMARAMTPYYEDDSCTIYHGDCREILPELSPDFAVAITSPPYWDARGYDDLAWSSYGAYLDGLRPVLRELHRLTTWVVWVAGYIWRDGRMFDCSGDAARIAESEGFIRRQQVPWVKSDYAPQPSIDLAPAHECIQLLTHPGDVWSDFDALRVTRRAAERLGRVASERPSAGAQRGGGAGWGFERFDGQKQAPNVLVAQKLNGSSDEYCGHPAAFPAEIVAPWVQALARPSSLVLDPYMGSGTTLRVAKDFGRHAIGIEISERYCEMAARRLGQEVLAL